MADIKQAAKWMLEGKSVRRAGWPKGELVVYTERSPTQLIMVSTIASVFVRTDQIPSSGSLSLRLESLLAGDWEIAE